MRPQVRNIAVLSLILASSLNVAALAEDKPAKPVEQTPSFKIAGKLSHAVQKYSGINFVSSVVASGLATAVFSIVMRGRALVKVRPYNFTDLLQGEFRGVDVKLASGKLRGIPIGSVQARTVTPFKLSFSRFKLMTPVLVAVDGQLSEKLVSKALESKSVTENLRFLKLDLPGLGEQHLQVLNPKVDVKGDQVEVTAHLITAGAAEDTGIDLKITATPTIEKERYIILKDIHVASDDIQNPEKFAEFAEELLNPLIDFGRMDRATHAFRVKSLQVKNERVEFSGNLLLAPKPAPPAKPAEHMAEKSS